MTLAYGILGRNGLIRQYWDRKEGAELHYNPDTDQQIILTSILHHTTDLDRKVRRGLPFLNYLIWKQVTIKDFEVVAFKSIYTMSNGDIVTTANYDGIAHIYDYKDKDGNGSAEEILKEYKKYIESKNNS